MVNISKKKIPIKQSGNTTANPSNHKMLGHYAGLMLVHRLKDWPSTKPGFAHCLVPVREVYVE